MPDYKKFEKIEENVRNMLEAERNKIVGNPKCDENAITEIAYIGYVKERNKSSEAGKRKIPISVVLKLANKLGVTVDGIFEGNRIPNPSPYNIDEVFKNIWEGINNSPYNWTKDNDDEDDNNYIEDNDRIERTVRNYKKGGVSYTKDNLRIELFLMLCYIREELAEDILRGNFEKTAKGKSTKATQEKEAVQK